MRAGTRTARARRSLTRRNRLLTAGRWGRPERPGRAARPEPPGPDGRSGPAGPGGPPAWDRIRRLRGRRLLLAAGAGVVLIVLLTTALVALTAGAGPFRPRLRSGVTGPPSQGLTTVAFSPDNSLLAAAGNGGSGYVWT